MAGKDDRENVNLYDSYRCREFTAPEFEEFIGHLSNGLYEIACDVLGNEDIIGMRRQVMGLHETLINAISSRRYTLWHVLTSGSRAEGLRFRSSDFDTMYIYNCIKVVPSISYPYDQNISVLLMECDKTYPGFVLMRLVGESQHFNVKRSCVPYLSGSYVSSTLWREDDLYGMDSSIVHGPCTSNTIGKTEYDHAYCLHSDVWPAAAHRNIQRLLQCKWPTPEVVKDIVNWGVDFVPISSKQSNFEFLEWRMSFSFAEKKLTQSMNHTQFMCYGILKIFLKEAINCNEEIKSILCSYYLKTAVFWEISNSSVQWVPSKLLFYFWQCFRKIIFWIHNEYLPNFFIPENNMLVGKLHPNEKKVLIDHLSILHGEGYSCLLRCPTFRHCLTAFIQRPMAVFDLQCKMNAVYKYRIHQELIFEIWNYKTPCVFLKNLQEQLCILQVLNYTLLEYNGQEVNNVLNIWWRLRMEAMLLTYHTISMNNSSKNNQMLYIIHKKVLNIFKRCRVDLTSPYIHIALCLYKCGLYDDVIHVTTKIKRKLQNQHLLYLHTAILDLDNYRAAGGVNTPYHVMLSHNIAWCILLDGSVGIPELKLEYDTMSRCTHNILVFPPLVITEFLNFLSCYRLGYHQLVKDSVSDLHALMQFDDGLHIHSPDRGISWHVLGICQEMIGDYRSAYQSYSQAFREPFSNIKYASETRMTNLTHYRNK